MSTVYRAVCDECGYSTTSKTAKLATYGIRSHSCDRQRAKDAARTRRIAREAAVDKTPKPCHHKQTNHQHGTHACYVLDACRCHGCTAANTAYERRRTRDHAYGRWNGYVDAQPARAHVQQLQARGMGWKRVARSAGVPTGTMWKLLYGVPSTGRPPSARIRPATESAILAVRLDLAGGAVVDGTGTARRIQALVACGWSMSKIAARLGIQRANFTSIAHGIGRVTVATDRAVRALYDELWDRTPPQDDHRDRIAASRALNYARKAGWAPPLAWDDDAMDNPAATPNLDEPDRQGRPDEIAEDVAFLLADDPLATAHALAERLGFRDRSGVQNALRRADRQDLLDRLARNARLAREGTVA